MQPELWTPDEFPPDVFTIGHNKPTIKHPEHQLRAMHRPFIAWDGEGYTDDWGNHHYWLLANSVGDRIESVPGKSIDRWNVARIYQSVQERIPDAVHVGFALGYDFTMQLRGNALSVDLRKELVKKQRMKSDGFMWRVMMGKQLTVWPEAGGNQSDRFNLQDSWGFFQRSFIKALDEYFPNPAFDKNYPDSAENPAGLWPYRDVIIEMKAKRATFTRSEDVSVKTYNDMELALLVTLMDELRDRLYQSGMPVSRWYGPGAIANGLLAQWKIKATIIDLYSTSPNLAAVCQFAYAGGRFELVRPGHVNGPVYQYDINSAYPHALRNVPNLAKGHWKHFNSPNLSDLPPFSVVRIRWDTHIDYSNLANPESTQQLFPESIPFPFWRRTPRKETHYPASGIHGWYWFPEVVSGINYGNSLPDYYKVSYSIEEAYGYYPDDPDEKPFSRIELLYNTRQKLKAIGSGSHIGIKLGLNSLYGKFAQQIGYSEDDKQIPRYHNLAIAGYITATCRAGMIDAMAENPTAIIAFETDGIFSDTPLTKLPVDKSLGGWECTTYKDMYYFQSGFRFGIDENGDVSKAATRGVPAKDISLQVILDRVRNSLDVVPIEHTQFITLGQAMAWNKPHLAGQWQTKPKDLTLMLESPKGKRIHDPDCIMCDPDKDGVRRYRWDNPHFTIPATGYEGSLNTPHTVLWSEVGTLASDEAQEDLLAEFDFPIEP